MTMPYPYHERSILLLSRMSRLRAVIQFIISTLQSALCFHANAVCVCLDFARYCVLRSSWGKNASTSVIEKVISSSNFRAFCAFL